MNSTHTTELMNKGIKCLIETLGIIDTEQFISNIMREKFDYTKWQREYFDHILPNDFQNAAISHARRHPFQMKNPE